MKRITDIVNQISKKAVGLYIKKGENKKTSALIAENIDNMILLNPGQDSRRLTEEYYTQKFAGVITAAGVMTILIILLIISRKTTGILSEGNRIRRNDTGDGDYSVELTAETEDRDYGSLNIKVSEKQPTDEQRDKMMDELYERLLTMVVGENVSLEHIDRDMNLPTEVDDYPLSIRWESSDYMIINTLGEVDNEELDDSGAPVELTAIMNYRGYEKTYSIKAVVYPPKYSIEEINILKLRESIDREDEDTKHDDYFVLPKAADGSSIIWKEKKEPIVPLMILITFCLMTGIWFGMDRDIRKKRDERNRQLVIDYAEFVSKLQVLLTSGATIRGALERMSADYRITLTEGGKKRYVYEELLICIRKLGDGMSETDCYEYFGRRCRVTCYRKLSSLLIQNLKKGTDGLISALDSEVSLAFEERKALARRMGEESQTRLMLPMMLMLSVVMIIIMIPAYLSFGGL